MTYDPFVRFLASFSGEVIRFCPGHGGVEDALASLSFLALCHRHGVAVAEDDDRPEAMRFFGSAEAAAAASERRLALLPTRIARFEHLGVLARKDAWVFCSDPMSIRVAELQGIPYDRRRLCADLACHVDVSTFDLSSGTGEGTVRLLPAARLPDDADGIGFFLSGRQGRWRSQACCRAAIQQVIKALEPYAEVRTDSLGFAILIAGTGRKSTLHLDEDGIDAASWRMKIATAYPAVTFETNPASASGERRMRDGSPPTSDHIAAARAGFAPPDRLAELRRDLRRAKQEKDALALQFSLLRERFDARVAEAAIASERDVQGTRLVPARVVEERLSAAEQRVLEAGAREAAAFEAAAAARAEAQVAARKTEEVERRLGETSQSLSTAFEAQKDEIEELRRTISEMAEAGRLSEMRVTQLLTLVDRNGSAKIEAERRASAARERLDAIVSSTSWKATRPVRALVDVLRRKASLDRGGIDP